nr:glycoside hydrolase family 95 protein [uncultured Acetatifactor sp.]
MSDDLFFGKTNSSSFMWDVNPASDWAESYPLGNGRLGAMVYGRPKNEIFALNHDLLWRDYLKHPAYGTYRDISEIKSLCRQKRWGEATRRLKRTIPEENAIYINPFVPAFDLYLNMTLPSEEISGYRRGLDLENGIARTEFVSGGVGFTRTAFCSYDYGAIVVHFAASAPGTLTGEVSLSRMLDPECEVTGKAGYGYVTISGEFEEGKRFGGAVRVLHRNGRITMGKRTYGIDGEEMPGKRFGLGYVYDRDSYVNPARGASVWFDSSDEVTLLVRIATDEEAPDPAAYCLERLSGLPEYHALYMVHKERFSGFYHRTSLVLEPADGQEAPDMTTPERIQESKDAGRLTPFMLELMYNSARYIAISSGMPQPKGVLPKAPINLQGIWCRDTRPAWESDYHVDLNIEMCYWPLVNGGLIEWYGPYLDWIERLMEQARACAADLYGARGATMNGCCDPKTLGGNSDVGFGWLGSAAWLGQILWIYYEHDLREETLMRIYDVLLPFAEFMEDMLTEDEDGRLTFPFGASPEMGHIVEGETIWFSSADTCDLELAQELFSHVAEAAEILGKPSETAERYRILAGRIRPLPVDGNGCLMEWVEDHVEAQPGHRHRSPLIGLCPGTMINKRTQPEICNAMEKLLDRRLAAGKGMATAFSFAWDTQFMARFHRGDEAYEILFQIIYLMLGNMLIATNDYNREGHGIPWFPGTKVVQVEAQICLMASIGEMFYQDNDGVISPIPALPSKIRNGSMTGITGRQGFVVDIYWKDGLLERMRVLSRFGKVCRINFPEGQIVETSAMPRGGETVNHILTFSTEAGREYTLTFASVR